MQRGLRGFCKLGSPRNFLCMCGFSYCMFANVVLNCELNFVNQWSRIVSLDFRLNFLSNCDPGGSRHAKYSTVAM